jgi:hypothetical protein
MDLELDSIGELSVQLGEENSALLKAIHWGAMPENVHVENIDDVDGDAGLVVLRINLLQAETGLRVSFLLEAENKERPLTEIHSVVIWKDGNRTARTEFARDEDGSVSILADNEGQVARFYVHEDGKVNKNGAPKKVLETVVKDLEIALEQVQKLNGNGDVK